MTEPLAAVVVVSQSKELITTLETSLAASEPIFVPDFKGLSRVLAQRAVGVIVLDAESNKRALKASLKLKAAHPEIAIVVACPRVSAEPFMPLLSEGVVYRVLIMPASPGQSRLLVSAALKAHIEMMRGRAPAAAPNHDVPPVTEVARSGFRIKRSWLVGAAAGLIAVVVALAFLFGGSNEPEPVQATANEPGVAAGSDAAPVQDAVDDIQTELVDETEPESLPESVDDGRFAAAELAFAQGNWFGPDSAFAIWAGIAAEDDANERARTGLERIADAQIRRLEQALVMEQVDQAQTHLETLGANFPDHPRLDFLTLQMERERQRQVLAEQSLAEASQAVEEAARNEIVADLTARAADQLEAGRLLQPADDSAAALLAEARRTDAASAEVQRLTRTLVALFVERFDAAVAAEDLPAATRWQQALASNGATSGQISETQSALELLQRAQDDSYIASVRERFAGALQSGAMLEPTGESARDYLDELRLLRPDDEALPSLQADFARALNDAVTAAIASENWNSAESWLIALREAPGAEATADQAAERLDRARRQAVLLAEVVPASVLTLLEYEPPDYPRAALQRGQEGWVDLELTVNTAGLPENIVVSDSEPTGVFDAAALESTQGYRFAPYLENDVPFARRVVLKIRFALE